MDWEEIAAETVDVSSIEIARNIDVKKAPALTQKRINQQVKRIKQQKKRKKSIREKVMEPEAEAENQTEVW